MSILKTKNQKRMDQFMKHEKFCSTCGNIRNEIKTEQLPAIIKKDLSFFGKDVRFLYCRHCDEYGILTKPEFPS
jgi:hypothetical protein